MNVFRRSIFLLCFTMSLVVGMAQVNFRTKLSATTIGKDELLSVTYEVENGTIQNFTQPSFEGFQIVAGPSVSSSTMISNGVRSSSMSYQFVLKPNKPGIYKIPGTTAVISGQNYTSRSASVTVTIKNTGNGYGQNNGPGIFDPLSILPPDPEPAPPAPMEGYDGVLLRPGEDIAKKTRDNAFIAVDVSKKTCYPGEAIKATYRLYSRLNLDARVTRRPSFSGFSSIDLPDDTNREYTIEEKNGKQFRVYPVRNVQLYPLLSGMQTLEPMEIESTVQYKKMPDQQSYIDPFATLETVNYPYVIKSEPVKVQVLPFPDSGKPADFNGVVGNFKINASLQHKELALNEAGKLVVTITGSGNWAMVQAPNIAWPEGVDVYEPKITESLDSQSIPLAGHRTYEYPFTTNKPGKLAIKPINFSFFDAGKKAYQTVATTVPLAVTILNRAAPVDPHPRTDNGISGEDNTQIFTDIVIIAFPVLAIVLIIWLMIRGNRYKYNKRKAVAQKKAATETLATAEINRDEQQRASRFQPPAERQTAEKVEAPENFRQYNTSNRGNYLTDYSNYPVADSRTYFSDIRKELGVLLKEQFNIPEETSLVTKSMLIDKGLEEQAAGNIVALLDTCRQHLYSPFHQEFDQQQCDALVTAINSAVRARAEAAH